jgi:hypothetical protein
MRWTVTFAFATVRAVHRRRLPALQAHLGSPPHAIDGREGRVCERGDGHRKDVGVSASPVCAH